jgi:hypothetical protein
MAFTAASRWLLGPRGVDWHRLCGGPTTRTMAFRHLAVANTFSALDARVRWGEDELMEIQRRVLLLRRTAAEVITICQGGKSADLRVKKLNLDAPPPWADSPWRPAQPAPEHHRHCRGRGRRLFHFYCPWAACHATTRASVPDDLDMLAARKSQLTCAGCGGQVCRRTVHVRTLPATAAGRV